MPLTLRPKRSARKIELVPFPDATSKRRDPALSPKIPRRLGICVAAYWPVHRPSRQDVPARDNRRRHLGAAEQEPKYLKSRMTERWAPNTASRRGWSIPARPERQHLGLQGLDGRLSHAAERDRRDRCGGRTILPLRRKDRELPLNSSSPKSGTVGAFRINGDATRGQGFELTSEPRPLPAVIRSAVVLVISAISRSQNRVPTTS
jgi:hypothetical protein